MKQELDHPFRPMHGGHNRRHAPETVESIIAALAKASYTEVGVAFGLTRNMVAGIVTNARARGVEVVTLGTLRRDQPARPVKAKAPRAVPKPRAEPRPVDAAPRVPSVPVPPAPVGPFGTGVTLLASTRRQCRAMDDAGECCAAPTIEGSSWCPAHRALYVRTSKVAA